MYSPRHSLFRKTAIGLVIFFFVFQLFSPAFLFKHEAVAFADTEAGETAHLSFDITTNVQRTTTETTKEVKDTVLDRIFKGLMLSASIALRNALVYLSQKLAEQTMNWMSTGEWGQGGMFYEQAWGKFTDDIVNSTVGVLLDNLRDEVWSKTGFNICEPALPSIKIQIMMGIELPNLNVDNIEQNQPDCTLSKFANNWEAFGDNIYSKYKEFEKDPGAMSLAYLQDAVQVSMDIKYTDLGKFLTLDEEVKQKQAENKAAEEGQRGEDKGVKGKTDKTGEIIKSPAKTSEAAIEKQVVDAKDMQKSEMESSKDVITEIPESMVAAFLGSFISKAFAELILKKLFDTGVTSNPESYKPKQYVFENKEQIEKEVAQAIQVQKVSFSSSTKEIDLLTQFTSCPQDRQINNCVVDGDFAQAVRAAEQDKPISLKEAIASGKVNGDLPLIPATDGRNSESSCFEKGWCYSNLTKLRKARIIPIGWEIAASKILEGESVTLKYAMDKFADAQDARFYHLIDPEWILRAPKARCEAEVSGPMLLGSGSDKRAPTCADLKSCIKQDETGKCKAWGYCAAEQNTFRFGGTSCPAQFDSCRLLTKVDGGAEASMLLNTADKTGCDPNSVGCKQYSVSRDPSASYAWSNVSTLFLNKKIKDVECKPEDEGCSRFIRTGVGLGTSLLSNGGFEVFYNQITVDPLNDNPVQDWWKTNIGGNLEITSDAFAGVAAVLLSSDAAYTMTAKLIIPKDYTRYYAISAKAKKKVEGANIALSLELATGAPKMEISSLGSGSIDLSSSGVDVWDTVYQIVQVTPLPGNLAEDLVRVKLLASGGDVVIDNVVFEEIYSPGTSGMHEYADYGTKNALYLKKAPGEFLCYDLKSVNGFLVADTPNDAVATDKIKGCAGFAKVCSPKDVGCETYSVNGGSEKVNGITSFADYCPQECNGYSTFRQDVSFLDNGYFPVYFIPATARQCTAEAVGCEEFTNMEDLAAGKEAKSYFSEVRLCAALPEKANECSNFYTWVAKESSGFQLQAYYLQDTDKDGAPDTSDVVDSIACNKEVFESQTNPNCRAFYNDGGSVYYREYSKTITCSADCHPYRRTLEYESYNGQNPQQRCESKKGTWKPNATGGSGECIFMTIPSESKVCSAQMAGCKAYKGNQAGNEQIMFNAQFTGADLADNFEPTLTTASIVTLPEGLVAKAHQLQIKNTLASFEPGEYVLSFWVKKAQAAATPFWLEVSPFDELTNFNIETNVTDDISNWRIYSYNFTVPEAEAFKPYKFVLYSGLTNFIYVDNLQIKKVEDVQYVIKGSWQTPVSCDADLFNVPLAQAHVGCKSYNDRAGNTHFLKSFSGLCPSDKVGCEALVDTKNSLFAFSDSHKEKVPDEIVCANIPTTWSTTTKYTGVKKITGTGNSKLCEYQFIDAPNSLTFNQANLSAVCVDLNIRFGNAQAYTWNATTNSCEVTTAGTSADSIMYLVNDEKFSCKSSEKGCMAVGLPSYKIVPDTSANPVGQKQIIDTANWETNFYKIDPDLFGTLNSPLCSSYALSCAEYKDDSDATYFFKDPQAKQCEWRKGAVGTEYKEAWFVKGTATDILCGGEDYTIDRYGSGVANNLKAYGDAGYAGWAGLCPGEQDKCTAFIDPTDKSKNPIGRVYYYFNNEQIDKTCTSVSRKAGCLMFNNTGSPNLTVSAELSYNDPSGAQTPGTLANPNNSNALIKVVRDRECGAWYDCKSSHWAWDPNLNKYMQVCDKMGVCTSLTSESDTPKCASFKNSAIPQHVNILTENVEMASVYQNRKVGWEYLDYSGYSVSSNAPLQFYDAYDISSNKNNPDFKLVNYDAYGDNFTSGQTSCTKDSECDSFCEVELDSNGQKLNNLNPDVKENFIKFCRCLSGVCARANPKKVESFVNAQSPACRAYPTADAPFPAIAAEGQAFKSAKIMDVTYKTAVPDPTKKKLIVAQKNLASGVSLVNDYGCFYSKFSYGGGAINKYFPLEYTTSALDFVGFCQEDHSISCTCDQGPAGFDNATNTVVIKTKTTCSSSACGTGDDPGDKPQDTGICMRQSDVDKQVENAYGWQGYCLERDKSITLNNTPGANPCLTWYPTDSMSGLQDIKNTIEAAGYNPDNSVGSFYTTSAKGWNVDWGYGTCKDNDVTCNSSVPGQPYVKAVNSTSDCYDYGANVPPSKNWMMCFHTGGDDARSYMEGYHDVVSRDIYENEIVGMVIKCDSNHTWEDWCDSGNATMQLWYDASKRYLLKPYPDANFDGFFIPKGEDHFASGINAGPLAGVQGFVGPIFALGSKADDLMMSLPAVQDGAEHNYVTTNGSMATYKFYKNNGTEAQIKDDIYPGYNGPWNGKGTNNGKAWTYWQAVWSGAQTNTPKKQQPVVTNGTVVELGGRGDSQPRPRRVNRYFFGGDKQYISNAAVKATIGDKEYVLPNTWPWDYFDASNVPDQEQIFLAPLFMATGFNNEKNQKKCVNTLTKQMDIASEVCNNNKAASPASEPDAKINVYKKENGGWDTYGPTPCDGAWVYKADGSYVWDANAKGVSASTPQGEELCSNVQCNVEMNKPTFAAGEKIPDGQKFTNEMCQTGWHCESAGEAAHPNRGWCKYFTATAGDALKSKTPPPLSEYKINPGMMPLVLACDTSYSGEDDGWKNYFGIRIMFDENGKYRGLWQAGCDDSGYWGGQGLEIDFVMKDYSTVIAQTNKPGVINENAAFTQNIYAKAIQTGDGSKIIDTAVGVTGGKVLMKSERAPMGSAFGGEPASTMKLIPDTLTSTSLEIKPGGSKWVDALVSETAQLFGGKPWGCDSSQTGLCSYKTEGSAFSTLQNYFAKIFQKWEWKVDGANGFGEFKPKLSNSIIDNTGTKIDTIYHGAPVVAAVVPTERTDKEGNLVYGAVPGKITVNGRTEGIVEGFDGALDASLKFYAWASDNQMPLKNVNVCWGDGICANLDGKFKNHKPRCQRTPNELLGLCYDSSVYGVAGGPFGPLGFIKGYACLENDECKHLPGANGCTDAIDARFGDASSVDLIAQGMGTVTACEESYFNFNYLYECEKADVEGGQKWGTCTSDKKEKCVDILNGKKVCRFKPNVQVKDNWGWYNQDAVWTTDGKTLTSMGAGSNDSLLTNNYEFFDGYIYVHPSK